MATGTAGSQPCGACRFLRRKCTSDCILAPYFCSEQGRESFAAIHKVFGASNVSKLLSHVPVAARRDAIITIAFEAQSRIKDPIYGCVSHVLALQQQVEYLQDEVMQMKAQLSLNLIDDDHQSSSRLNITENDQWPRSCINIMDDSAAARIIGSQTELLSDELHQLALRMMNN